MRVIAWLIDGFYVVFPLYAIVIRARDARRKKSWRAMSPLLSTFVSALAIALLINFAYAHAAAANVRWSEILISTVFVFAVLLVMKSADDGLQKLLKRQNRKWVTLTVRLLVFALFGLPFVMAVAMVHRTKVRGPDPMEQFGRKFEDVTFGSDVKLSGWWIDGQGDDTVLLCHGLGSSKSNALPIAEHLLRIKCNLFVFDFRAHGDSAGHVSTFGDLERNDVLAAVQWLNREKPQQSRHIFGVGASMGAAALIAASADPSAEGRAIDAVAVYGTYDDLGGVADTMCNQSFPRPLNWLGRYVAMPIASVHAGSNLRGFAPADFVAQISPRPILIIHGRTDEVIAFAHGRRLFDSAAEPKRSLWIDGDHNSVLMDNSAAAAVRELFESVRTSSAAPSDNAHVR